MIRAAAAMVLLVTSGLVVAPLDASAQLDASARVAPQSDLQDPAPRIDPPTTAAEYLLPTPGPLTLSSPPQERVGTEELRAAEVLPQARARNRRGVPFMVAGGVLIVAGAIAGNDVGTILILGGAGLGAYGAFTYFGG